MPGSQAARGRQRSSPRLAIESSQVLQYLRSSLCPLQFPLHKANFVANAWTGLFISLLLTAHTDKRSNACCSRLQA